MQTTTKALVHLAEPPLTPELRQITEFKVRQVLSESSSIDDAGPRILQAIGESLGWELGVLWSIRGPDVLHLSGIWHGSGLAVAEFNEAVRRSHFPPGIGLPGRVWKLGEPAWISNVLLDTNFPRLNAAAKVGLHGAFGFPIIGGSRMYGVIEFFTFESLPPDDDLLQFARELGVQLGQFEERQRECELHRLHAELLRALADPLRLELLHLLVQSPRTKSELAAATGKRPRNISGHLAALRQQGIIQAKQIDSVTRYSLASSLAADAYRTSREQLVDHLARQGVLASLDSPLPTVTTFPPGTPLE